VSKRNLSKSLLAIVAVLMASTVTRTVAQTIHTPAAHHILLAGDPGGTAPDPTGDPGGN